MTTPISITLTADNFHELAEQLRVAGNELSPEQGLESVILDPLEALKDMSVDDILEHVKERVDGDGMTVALKEKPKRRGRKPKADSVGAEPKDQSVEDETAAETSSEASQDTDEDVLPPKKTRAKKGNGKAKAESTHIPAPSKGVPEDQQAYEQALAMLSTCYASPKGKPAVKKLLADYGVAKFSEIPATEGEELLEKAVEILNAVKGK